MNDSRATPSISRDDVPALVRHTWMTVLDLDAAEPEDDFFSSGGHSLSAVELITKLDAHLGTAIDMEILFDIGTLRGLTAECLRQFDSQANDD